TAVFCRRFFFPDRPDFFLSTDARPRCR
ncbi:ORFL65C, partial [Human betaherpesvirus 5]